MNTDADLARRFKETFEQYPFLFKFTETKKENKITSPDYVSKDFCKIAEKIDELLQANSIKDYVLNFANTTEINVPDYSNPALTTQTLYPLKDSIIINEKTIEGDSIKFTLFTEQLVINFGINLCISLSEIMKSERSAYIDKTLLEPIEQATNAEQDFFETEEKHYKKESKEQAQRIYPKVWELFEDNKKLRRCLGQSLDALKLAISLEPYFIQSKMFHQIFSQLPIATNQRFIFVEEFFLTLNKVKTPTENIMIVSRALLILRVFNPLDFEVKLKRDVLITSALIQSRIFETPYEESSVRRIYFATMRNH